MSNGSFSQAGFYYQNNVAALKILGLLDLNSDVLDVSLENYDKGEHIDDIIINKKDSIEFYQVKWSHEITNSYTIHNLAFQVAERETKSLWRKLADGYTTKVSEGKKATIILYSPRQASTSQAPSKGITKSLRELISFQHKFQKGNNTIEQIPGYDEFKPILEKLKTESALSEDGFSDFFKTLHLHLGAPELPYIKLQIQNKADQFGLENTQIEKLLNLVVEWSISGKAVTKEVLLTNLGIRDRFVDRLSHVFKIDEANYIEDKNLFAELNGLLGSINNGYVFIEGVPGAGKSTALTKYAAQNRQIRFSYYCFIPEDTTTKESRLKGEFFVKSLCVAIEKSFPEVDLPLRYSDDYEGKLGLYFEKISSLGEKIIFLVDGLDHVERSKDILPNPLTNTILSALPDNLIIIITSQYIEALPPMIRAEIGNDSKRHIKINRFSESQIRVYLQKKSLHLTDEQVTLLLKKSEGIPLYLRYITSVFEDSSAREYNKVINEFPALVDSKINTYHALLFQKIDADLVSKWILSLLANRKEFTSIQIIKEILKIAGLTYNTLQISQSLKTFKHLLKEIEGEYYTIFHNSFREYIILNTTEIRDDLNLALINYYGQDVFEEEAYRNYFSHLFILKRYQPIIDIVNEGWINESWRRFRRLEDILQNINIAWNACVQLRSISEFVRIAFLKHQVDYAGYNLSHGDFDEPNYFLDGGLYKESLRTVWDGEFSLVANEDFFNYYAVRYEEETGNQIPFYIATQFFTTFIAKATAIRETSYQEERNNFGAYFKARTLYLKPPELIQELRELTEHVTEEVIQSLVEYLRAKNKLAYLRELWEICIEGPVKNFILSALLSGLYKLKSNDARHYENEFSFAKLEADEKISFVENLISHIPEKDIIIKYNITHINTFSDEGIISSDFNYKLKPEFINLLQALKVSYFLNEQNYIAFELKVSSLPHYPRVFYFALSSCAKAWAHYKRNKSNSPLPDDLKKIIDNLTIPGDIAQNITSGHGEKAFIQYEIHRINKLIFNCFNEMASDNDLKEIIPYWIRKHQMTGFPHYKSDLAFAEAIIKRTNLKDEIYDLVKHAELLARGSHDTSGLVDSLSTIGSMYGKAAQRDDYNRIYVELLTIACGVSYRKDYQFANIFSVLEEAHKVHPESTLQRLADNYYLLFKIKDAGNARMFHICLSELIGLMIKFYPQLAFTILMKDDMFLGRDEALDIILHDIIPECNDADIPYLWAIIKTKNKWEDFGKDDDHNVMGVYKSFFTRLLKYADVEFVEKCYLYLYRQFTVEQNIPHQIIKINKILQGGETDYLFLKVPEPKSEKIPITGSAVEPPEKEKPAKFLRKAHKSIGYELSEMAKKDISEIEKEILSFQVVAQYNRFRPSWQKVYKDINKELEKWFSALSPDLKISATRRRIKSTRMLLETINAVADEKNITSTTISKAVKELIGKIDDVITGGSLKEFIEKEIELKSLLKPLYQSIPNSVFIAQRAITDTELLELVSDNQSQDFAPWENLIMQYYDKPVLVQAYLLLSKKSFTYDPGIAGAYLEKAFRVAESISYKTYDWETELLEWAYTCMPDKANYYVLQSFYAEHTDREGELIYHLSNKVRPWECHFKEPDFYEIYYQSNYQYNIILAEGLPDPEINPDFIITHKETADLQTSTLHYLINLFDYPVIKIRQLAMQSVYELYGECGQQLREYALKNLQPQSPNIKEHFIVLLNSLAINHASEITDIVNKMGWIFNDDHYNIRETFADLVKFLASNDMNIESQLINTAARIHQKPAFPQSAIIRTLQHKNNFALSWYQNVLIKEITDLENGDYTFSDELYTLLIDEGYDVNTAKDTESRVHRNYNINGNFDPLEINGPTYKTIQEKMNRLFTKHIRQGILDNEDIEQLKYEFRIYDPTDAISLRVRRPDYVSWKGESNEEKDFINFTDVDEIIAHFLKRQDNLITLFEKGYERIDSYPSQLSQYFEAAIFLADKNVPLKGLEKILADYNSYFGRTNIYRSEMADYFADAERSGNIKRAIQPLIGVSDKYYRHKLEDSIAILLAYISKKLELSRIPHSLNYQNKEKVVIEFKEWQAPFKDHDRRRFEALSQGCTLNIERDLIRKYISQEKKEVYIHLKLRRSIDKYKGEWEMQWFEKSFTTKIII